jgi:hypothetical protein
VQFDAVLGKPPGLELRGAVGGDDLDAATRERGGRGETRPGQADDEDAARELRQRRKNV